MYVSFKCVNSIVFTDVVHLVFRPIYLFPSWTCPRDFVLVRYWRFEPDGSYVICYESVQHRDCPRTHGVCQGGEIDWQPVVQRGREKVYIRGPNVTNLSTMS